MTDIIQQIIGALIAIAVALGGTVAYFWGTNWLLDKFLSSPDALSGSEMTRRDNLRSQIRPWLFLFPALYIVILGPAVISFVRVFGDLGK